MNKMSKKLKQQIKRGGSLLLAVLFLCVNMPVCTMAYVGPEATNDYTTWKQTSASWSYATPWPYGRNFGRSGCWVTSVAILLRHYGIVKEADVNKFNPLICNQKLMENGIINSCGDYVWAGVERIDKAFPGFHYEGRVGYSFETLKNLYNQGYACIVHETRGHYVAVKEVTDAGAVVMDPGYNDSTLTYSDFIQYFSINRKLNSSGCVDVIANKNGTLEVGGWAFDNRDYDSSLAIQVCVGATYNQKEDAEIFTLCADKSRPDVGQAYPDAGDNHGFYSKLYTDCHGLEQIYIYACNPENMEDRVMLGAKTVTLM